MRPGWRACTQLTICRQATRYSVLRKLSADGSHCAIRKSAGVGLGRPQEEKKAPRGALRSLITIACALTLAGLASTGCHQELGVAAGVSQAPIEVADLTLKGVEAFDDRGSGCCSSRAASAHACRGARRTTSIARRSRATWHASRRSTTTGGYPAAEVTSFNIDPSEASDAVLITITLAEGEPIRLGAVELARSGRAFHRYPVRRRRPCCSIATSRIGCAAERDLAGADADAPPVRENAAWHDQTILHVAALISRRT